MIGRPWMLIAIALGLVAGTSLSGGSAASVSLTSQAFTPYRTCTVTATPVSTVVVVDTTVQQGSPTSNFGATTAVTVSSGSGVNQRIYLTFDLTACSPAIPASAIVRLATLRLYMTAVPAACRTLDLFRVTVAWTETAITWNNQPFGTAISTRPAPRAAARSASAPRSAVRTERRAATSRAERSRATWPASSRAQARTLAG